MEVKKTGTLGRRVRSAQAPAGARGQRPRREFLSTIWFTFVLNCLALRIRTMVTYFQSNLFHFLSHMYSFFPPCSCSTIAKELKLNSYLKLLIKLWKEKMPIDQKHKQNACFYVPPKSQCKHCHTCNWKGQTKPHLGKMCFFYQHCFTKNKLPK